MFCIFNFELRSNLDCKNILLCALLLFYISNNALAQLFRGNRDRTITIKYSKIFKYNCLDFLSKFFDKLKNNSRYCKADKVDLLQYNILIYNIILCILCRLIYYRYIYVVLDRLYMENYRKLIRTSRYRKTNKFVIYFSNSRTNYYKKRL